MRRVWLAGLAVMMAACSSPPELRGVSPAEAVPGAEITVLGDRFAEGATAKLVPQGGGAAVGLADAAVQGTVAIQGKVPADLKEGTYDVVVDVGGQATTLTGALQVLGTAEDKPCSGEYTANTQVSVPRKLVVVDRFMKSGERDTLKVDMDDITGVEVERVVEGDTVCSVIWMRKKDGTRFLFFYDDVVDLTQRAYKVANTMGKPAKVTREDAIPEGVTWPGDPSKAGDAPAEGTADGE